MAINEKGVKKSGLFSGLAQAFHIGPKKTGTQLQTQAPSAVSHTSPAQTGSSLPAQGTVSGTQAKQAQQATSQIQRLHSEFLKGQTVSTSSPAVKPGIKLPPQRTAAIAPHLQKEEAKAEKIRLIDEYVFKSKNIPITIKIYTEKGWFVPLYEVFISSISPATEFVLEKIREELIKEVSLGIVDITASKQTQPLEYKFEKAISILIDKYFPGIQPGVKEFFVTYLIQRALGLGNIDILMDDVNIEEVAINSAEEPVWIYHKKHGWLRTSITIKNEEQTRHYASTMARKVGRQISILEPLLDAHMDEGDRVNATLLPISTRGNTITLRMFSRDPWTITKFIKARTISLEGASLVWLAIQYELSALIAGGTATGKTSMLNVLTNFFPPNQRIISIEDTREIQLPRFLHWVPMSTRVPNAENKGGISMLDLLVNSLRMRPDRIVVGEVRRKREAEVLFEAIHTGHSVYATFHANNSKEAVTRLINAPIEIPRTMLPAISMIITQFRNRRTGLRRTFQIAEIKEDGDANVILQFDPRKDVLHKINRSKVLMDTIQTYTGYSPQEINRLLVEKEKVLKYLMHHNLDTVDEVGLAMAEYYTNHDEFMQHVHANRMFSSLMR